MITENYEAYADGGTQKDFRISVVGEETVIENSNMLTESIKLDEALCSDENLRFGCCEASQFTVQVANIFDNFEGKKLAVTVTMDEETTKYGTFKVLSDKPTADRVWRTITAYDAMRDIINADVLEWYNALTFPMTIRAFRDSFFNHLGITQKAVTLINDSFEVKGGFSATGTLSGKTIINSICEFNGVFGHINRDGNFEYVSLDSASNFICPPYQNNSVTYEDYVTEAITKVTMRGSTDDIGTSVGADGNEYIIQNNPLIYGTEGTQALITAITNLLNKISQVTFRPYSLGKTIGNPCVELGDSITISTRYQTINSYVIKRVLSGIQALRDSYSATGYKVYPKEVNSIQEQINRTQGKMNELSRTVDETVSTVTRVEQIAEAAQETADGLADDVQTANNNASTALSTANNANTTAVTAQSQVTQMADQIVLKVDNNGNVVKVALSSDASQGSNVLIKGDNIQLDGNVTITSGFRLTAGVIQSANYVAQSTGMKIDLSTGQIIFNDVGSILLNSKANPEGIISQIGVYNAGGSRSTRSMMYSYGIEVEELWFGDTVKITPGVITVTNNNVIDGTPDQTVIKQDSINANWLTANKILVSDSDKNIVSSSLGISDLITTSNIGSQYVNKARYLQSVQNDGSDYPNQYLLHSRYNVDGDTRFKLEIINNNSSDTTKYGIRVDYATNAEPVFKNNTWYTVGDDVRIGDRDVGGCLCLQGLTSDITGLYFLSQNGNYGEKLYLANDGNFYVKGRDAYGRAANINPLWLKSLADTNLSSYKLDVDVSFANLENGLFNLYTNWNNSGNMPANYGSGMIIPFLDSAYKMHIYGTTAGHLWLGITQNHTWSALKKFMFGYAQDNFTYAVTGIGKIADSNNFYGTSDSGNYYWGVAAWSDKRLKKNIKESKVQALDLINKIQLKEFDFKDEKFGSHESIGYVAQDLLDVIPEAVQSIPLSDEEDKQKYGADKLYMVEDKHLIKYLVKAVQELTDIVAKQQQQTQELKQSNNFYQNIILQMQAEIEQIKQKTEE